MRSFGDMNANFGHRLLDIECLAPRDRKRVNVMSTFETLFAHVVLLCDAISCVICLVYVARYIPLYWF